MRESVQGRVESKLNFVFPNHSLCFGKPSKTLPHHAFTIPRVEDAITHPTPLHNGEIYFYLALVVLMVIPLARYVLVFLLLF